MGKTQQHWPILQKLGTDLTNRVRSFMVIGEDGEGVLVATKDGKGFLLGTMKFGSGKPRIENKPTPLDVPELIHMAQSYNHILLLNKRGEIYSMGKNDYGQLGLGIVDEEICFSPQLISSPHKFIFIRCGRCHSLALAEDGKVWAWGSNFWGQVGAISSINPFPSLRQIFELDPHRVVAVECGEWHSLALTARGEVYAWGRNDWGQLGDGIRSRNLHGEHGEYLPIPTRISTPSPVKSISAGSSHTLLLTRTGEVYACGWNKDGQLGLPNATRFSRHLVKVVGLPPISEIASHSSTHLSIAMTSYQQCYVWGELVNEEFIFTPRKLPSSYTTVESPLSSFSINRSTPNSVSVPGGKSFRRTTN